MSNKSSPNLGVKLHKKCNAVASWGELHKLNGPF